MKQNCTCNIPAWPLYRSFLPGVLLEPSHLLTIEIVGLLLIITILEVLLYQANNH